VQRSLFNHLAKNYKIMAEQMSQKRSVLDVEDVDEDGESSQAEEADLISTIMELVEAAFPRDRKAQANFLMRTSQFLRSTTPRKVRKTKE